jgi:hypothetical protein
VDALLLRPHRHQRRLQCASRARMLHALAALRRAHCARGSSVFLVFASCLPGRRAAAAGCAPHDEAKSMRQQCLYADMPAGRVRAACMCAL